MSERWIVQHRIIYVAPDGTKLDPPRLVGVTYVNSERRAKKTARAARLARNRKHAKARGYCGPRGHGFDPLAIRLNRRARRALDRAIGRLP